LSGCDLTESNLQGTKLPRANLSGVNLSGLALVGFDLSGCNLSQANLSRCNVSRVKLSGATLSGANLSGLDLSGCDLSGCNPPLSGANLSGANVSGLALVGFDLSGGNLAQANLSYANLAQANLSQANLSLANLSKANIAFSLSALSQFPIDATLSDDMKMSDSSILTGPTVQSLLVLFGPRRPISLQLLYRGTRHSSAASAFHSKCDGRAPTLTVVRSGRFVFGGFASQPWHQRNAYIHDDGALVGECFEHAASFSAEAINGRTGFCRSSQLRANFWWRM